MLHVLTHDSHRSQSCLGSHTVDFTRSDLLGKLSIEHLTCQRSVHVAHTDRSTVLRRCLGHEEHADAVLCQCAEDAVVHTDHAYHAETLHRDERRVVDARDTLDGLRIVAQLSAYDSTCSLRVEGILDQYRYILVECRIYRRRIHHLGTEVAQLHRLHIAQLVDGIGSRYHLRVGRHESVHVGPYLQDAGIQHRRNHRCRVVRTATAQVGHAARILVRCDEARHHRHLGQFVEGLLDKHLRQFRVEQVLVMLALGLHEGT